MPLRDAEDILHLSRITVMPFFSSEKFSSRQTGTTHAPDFSGVRTRTPSRGLRGRSAFSENAVVDDKRTSSLTKASSVACGKKISADSRFSSSFREGGSVQTLRSIMSPAADSPSLKKAVPNDRQMLSELFNPLKGAAAGRQKSEQAARSGHQRKEEPAVQPHQKAAVENPTALLHLPA